MDNSGNLFNTVIEEMKLKNDAALSRLLGVGQPVISKIRHGTNPVGAALILAVHEAAPSLFPVHRIRKLMVQS